MHDSFVNNHWVCIVGALASSCDTLPENMRSRLEHLINTILNWLTELLDAGKKQKDFSFPEEPETKALMVHSTKFLKAFFFSSQSIINPEFFIHRSTECV